MFFFFSSRRRHTRFDCDWSSDVCSSDLMDQLAKVIDDGDGGPLALEGGGETAGGGVVARTGARGEDQDARHRTCPIVPCLGRRGWLDCTRSPGLWPTPSELRRNAGIGCIWGSRP